MYKKIDIFAHILTPRYAEKFASYNPEIKKRVEYATLPVADLTVREKLMSTYPDVVQVVTMANIPLEKFCPEHSPELARIGNEELAELVSRRPDMFFGAVAVLPMNDVDASVEEIDYALGKLQLSGIQVQTRIGTEWLASEKFRPILAKMAQYNRPIWIHPDNNDNIDFDIGIFSWPFETTHCMLRLVESGVFNEFPHLKFIVHHAGAMVPYFKDRLNCLIPNSRGAFPGIHEHFKKFYVDTAIYGNTDALMCAYNYYGADHMFFGTDAPLGPRMGLVEDTIRSIEKMNIPEDEKDDIFRFNAVKLFKKLL